MTASKDKFFELLASGREDDKWDFKQDIKLKPKESFYQFLKDVLAFSNTGGGYLLLGVEDKTHHLVGVKSKVDEAELGDKIEANLGYAIKVDILYFKHKVEDEKIELGIIYIPKAEKINVAPKNFTGQKEAIVQAWLPYVRRNTRSVVANRDDFERLTKEVKQKGDYAFKEWDLQILQRNNEFSNHLAIRINKHIKGEFLFTSNEFANKIHEIYVDQIKYNKLEFARLIGFEDHKIDDYFEGKAFPTLEQILRIVTIFDLPQDYFFKPTLYGSFPIWQNPMVSYCIIDKVKDRGEVFNLNQGEFFKSVLQQLSKGITLFTEWLNSTRPEKPKNSIEKWLNKQNSHYLYEYLDDWSDEDIENFKKHLAYQNYKILEYFEGENYYNELMNEEKVLNVLIQLNEERICRVINESIKEIRIENKNVEVLLHFIEEIKNKESVRREYDAKTVALTTYRD
ncbi:helix-turn-helix domain-containing protein [Priestia megaterium]|uniref:AlbA family DNA-binding domain-containing protein n=1 Tax=Priestia megaterium TaxID=1404 RepID=UPI000CA2E0DD|nr:ATP-binding protein [Priestia megaterium]AUO12338.1 ATP-binding protein [Priestia megaterium]